MSIDRNRDNISDRDFFLKNNNVNYSLLSSLSSSAYIDEKAFLCQYNGPTNEYKNITGTIWVGADVGSTTAKIAVLDPSTKELLFWKYRRHFSKQAQTIAALICEIHDIFSNAQLKISICGSGAEPIAKSIGGFFIQEVISGSIVVSEFFPFARTCIELGGQDAKILFFKKDEKNDKPKLFDMRMNGCCAGGTGAFLDQMSKLIDIPVEELDKAAQKGTTVYDISGRCGVFAKTDLQPLLNMGVKKEDIALSVFHSVAKQTINGLGHGTNILPPVVFMGGPFTFNPYLVKVFAEHLKLKESEIIIPQLPQIAVAIGAALSNGVFESNQQIKYKGKESLIVLLSHKDLQNEDSNKKNPFFENDEEFSDFIKRHSKKDFVPKQIPSNSTLNVYIGIDAGSTTIKFVIMDDACEIINKFYSSNMGNPINVVKRGLLDIYEHYNKSNIRLNVLGVGSTGYGESLIAKSFSADYHTVETIAHAHAALKEVPDATFVLDLGGQDMKAMKISNGVIVNLFLNEACSAGCGSFIETLAHSMNIPIKQVAELAFKSKNPSMLGSRCTVFMNSSITTEQKNGKSIEDIMAGLCFSVIDNLFTKVIRDKNSLYLGNKIVVQGGTFKNDAILRAFEKYTGKKVIRPFHCGEMGAYGIALLTRQYMLQNSIKQSSFIGFEKLKNFECSSVYNDKCNGCTNNCKRTIVKFNNGTVYCAGNRCEKGNIDSSPVNIREKRGFSVVKLRENLLVKDYKSMHPLNKKNIIIGIPRVLEFFNSLPFWKALFTYLGYDVLVSPKSNEELKEKGIRYVASDNICFPAKIAHGHIEYLLENNVDLIFMPVILAIPSKVIDKKCIYTCPVLHGYPVVLESMNKPLLRNNIPIDSFTFYWQDKNMRKKQILRYLKMRFGVKESLAKKAIKAGEHAENIFKNELKIKGKEILLKIKEQKKMGVILAARPYHYDSFVCHGIDDIFSSLGVDILTLDSLPDLDKIDIRNVRPDLYNPFHSEVYSAAVFASLHPSLEIVQLVSFGCGHDAIISDELCRIMAQLSNKQPLILKIDEGEALGALGIRIRSFVETARKRL